MRKADAATIEYQVNQTAHGINGHVEVIRPVKTVALVGHSPSTRMEAPFNDATAEIWTMNDAHHWIPRATRWFEIHHETVWRSEARRSPGYLDHLARFNGPIYMQTAWPEIPNSVAYPFRQMVERYGRVFSSSFSWLFALAVAEGFARIEVYGCDLSSELEYIRQREATAWWIGYCRGLGIDVYLPMGCPLLSGPLYGQGEDVFPGVTWDLVENRFAEIRKAQSDSAARLNNLGGHLEEAVYWRNLMEKARVGPIAKPAPVPA